MSNENEGKPRCLCIAHGCPLPGVYTHSLQGSNDWLCLIHDGLEGSEWQEATRRIHDRLRLFRLLFRLQNSDAGESIPDATREGLAAAGYPNMGRSEECDTCRKLGYELRAVLSRECKGESAHVPEPLSKPKETWANVAGLVGSGIAPAFSDDYEPESA